MYYQLKYDKYLTKLQDISKVKYYFNTYGKPIPEKYYMLLNLINIRKASNEEYLYIFDNANNLAKDDYNARVKLIIGSYNIIFTLFTDDSVLNFIITDNNTCYIETYCGFSLLLLNLLKELCFQNGINKIETFSIYQPETNFLIENGFIQNKNRYLEYVL
jgi:hypothetical protein